MTLNVRTAGRVNIPRNPEKMLHTAELVAAKHQLDGNGSPLHQIPGTKIDAITAKIALAKTKHQEAEELKARAEQAYRERDLCIEEITPVIQASARLLKAINADNPKRLADWGFEIDDSPKAKKKVE